MNLLKRLILFILNLAFFAHLLNGQDQGMVTDSSLDFLEGDAAGATVATAAPTIDFGTVDVASAGAWFTHWCNVVLGPDGRYYFAVGDHDPEGIVMLISYDPVTKKDSICIDSRLVPGLADGKWHGRPVIHPETGDMYLIGFYNGDIVHYNIFSGEVETLGRPITGYGFEESIWDWQRDRLYGIAGSGEFLVYDTRNQSVVFFGEPVDSETNRKYYWEFRSRLLDQETGILYGSDFDNNIILSYDPSDNTFHALKSSLESSLRAWSNVKEPDGSFWVFDRMGNVFKFFPEEDRLEPHGTNWDMGSYVSFIERSPGGRYLYYSMANSSSGMPVVQFDTQTDTIKVIAFLADYYFEKYDFDPLEIYGGALSKDGSSIFMVSNGTGLSPGMFHVHIPESERSGEATGTTAGQPGIPSDITLENYPNPFKSSTSISYSLPSSDFVTLRIFNSHGQEVQNPLRSYQLAGTYSIEFNAGDLPNGIYFCTLYLNGKHIRTNHMLLIK